MGETTLISIIDKRADAFRAAGNDMLKGAQRVGRKKDICSALQNVRATNWVGTVLTLSSNSAGKGVFAVKIAEGISLETTNNEFSESIDDLKTLIEPNSPVYSQVSSLRDGQTVVFSGMFEPSDDDCLHEESLTQEGSMTSPAFLFRFEAVSPR